VDNATLNRFFSLHYLLPFVIAALVAVHIWAFHTTGNNNPTGVEVRRTSKEEAERDTVPFWPYFVIKDLFALAVILAVFFAIVGFMPNYLGHPDNYIEANPLATPAHIVPEWYFLPFYAILRAFTADVWVVIARPTGSPSASSTPSSSACWRCSARSRDGAGALARHLVGALGPLPPDVQVVVRAAVVDFIVLMWVGAMPAEGIYAYDLADRLGLLVRLLPGHPAASGRDREAAAAAGDDRGRLQRPLRQARPHGGQDRPAE
jgi:ubiquinol-cytochrome c reductase cytochrome b subunit